MKKLFLILITFSFSIYSQTTPISGKSFVVEYNTSVNKIFSQNDNLTLVYAFDFWSTKGLAIQGKEALFSNVLNPDPGRKNELQMETKNGIHSAEIKIPQDAMLLSYYITDGSKFDYNDKKTYISYVFNENGTPVKGARFSNIDFMIMSGATPEDCIIEIEKELADYPDYHVARFVLWSKRFETKKDFDQIIALKNEAEKEFESMKVNFPNDYELLNSEAKVYMAFQQSMSRLLMPYFQSANDKVIEIAKQIPDGKRSSTVERMYQGYLQQKKSEKFTVDIVGQPAPEFEFITIKGEKKKLSDFRGKIVLLDFWGTWCGPCVGEIPNLVRNYNKFKEMGFEVISVSSDLMMKSKDEIQFKKFVDENDMSWTHVLDDQDKTIHTLYNIVHWPTLFLVDREGKIIKNETVLRGSDLEKTLEEVFAAK